MNYLQGYDPAATAGTARPDADAAAKALAFFPRFLQHIKGRIAGQPFAPNPWEEQFLTTLLGWTRPDGSRRYREAFVAVPRKNNKSTLCAGLGLYLLLCDQEQGAEVYCAAGDRDQATLVFDIAAKMVMHNPKLSQLCKVLDATKRITFGPRDSFLRAIPADAAGSHGFNAHAVVLDELHTQPSRDLYDVLKTSMASRRQPLMVSITTAGHDRESICYELWQYARKVRDGDIDDPSFLPLIYEAEDADDWTDPKVWQRVNPNYGRSVTHEYLEEAFERARTTPSFENTFRNLHLNLWTESETRWLASEQWEACHGELLPDLTGRDCIAGLDLASTDDLSALVYVFPLDKRYYVVPMFWCPEQTVAYRPKKYHTQYTGWRTAGHIVPTPGSATDYSYIRMQILEDAKRFNIREICFDPWQALDTFQQLEAAGMNCVKVPQNYAGLSPGVKAVEEAVLSGNLVHDGNPVMRWMLANTVLDQDPNGNRKPNKRKSTGEHGTKGKIDGMVALIMAMGRAGLDPGDNVYDYRGILTV